MTVRHLLPKTAQNPISSVGILLTTVSALLFIMGFVVDFLGLHTNPYFGIIAFVTLPALFVLGLLLIPFGMARERQRLARGQGPSRWVWSSWDLNDDRQRRIAGIVL
ncbi:MAG: nas, partial [Acidobacteria bacterium]|nr:nas [Acidobacteriota bacterium]